MSDPPLQATALLQRAAEGDRGAREELLGLLYRELHALAEAQMRGERADHTLQPTALLNEAWIRLVETPGDPASGLRGPAAGHCRGRSHFLCTAARAMRNVLVDHARRRAARKRGAPAERVALDEALAPYEDRALDLVALDETLERLGARDAELARVVELRFFGGLTAQETAAALGLSVRQVEGAWVTARGWLRQELGARNSP
jgi:RNA polymerase sigma factor (TIGR02999 family)